MKTNISNRRGNSGSALLVVLALLMIMVIFVAANTATTNWLSRQVKLVDQREIHRLAQSVAHPSPAK